MGYCNKHGCNNCIECAIQRQTELIIEAMERIAAHKDEDEQPVTHFDRVKHNPCGCVLKSQSEGDAWEFMPCHKESCTVRDEFVNDKEWKA